jgi:hypothetical protein
VRGVLLSLLSLGRYEFQAEYRGLFLEVDQYALAVTFLILHQLARLIHARLTKGAAPFQPIRQALQVFGKAVEFPHWLVVPVRRYRNKMTR